MKKSTPQSLVTFSVTTDRSRGGSGCLPPSPLQPKIFSISCGFFWKIWQNCMLVAPWRVSTHSYRESWIRPWLRIQIRDLVRDEQVLLDVFHLKPHYFIILSNYLKCVPSADTFLHALQKIV